MRDLPRGSAQRAPWPGLFAVPQLPGLEDDQNWAVRSLENPLSAERPSRAGAVRQVPHKRSRRKATIHWHFFCPVLGLPQGSSSRQFRAELLVLSQHRRLEENLAAGDQREI